MDIECASLHLLGVAVGGGPPVGKISPTTTILPKLEWQPFRMDQVEKIHREGSGLRARGALLRTWWTLGGRFEPASPLFTKSCAPAFIFMVVAHCFRPRQGRCFFRGLIVPGGCSLFCCCLLLPQRQETFVSAVGLSAKVAKCVTRNSPLEGSLVAVCC